jgi:hypothetical protein
LAQHRVAGELRWQRAASDRVGRARCWHPRHATARWPHAVPRSLSVLFRPEACSPRRRVGVVRAFHWQEQSAECVRLRAEATAATRCRRTHRVTRAQGTAATASGIVCPFSHRRPRHSAVTTREKAHGTPARWARGAWLRAAQVRKSPAASAARQAMLNRAASGLAGRRVIIARHPGPRRATPTFLGPSAVACSPRECEGSVQSRVGSP